MSVFFLREEKKKYPIPIARNLDAEEVTWAKITRFYKDKLLSNPIPSHPRPEPPPDNDDQAFYTLSYDHVSALQMISPL